jgi:hypothetical protein
MLLGGKPDAWDGPRDDTIGTAIYDIGSHYHILTRSLNIRVSI